MTTSNIRPRFRRSRAAVMLLAMTACAGAAAAQTQLPAPSGRTGTATQPAANPQAVALAEFQQRLNAYLQLRESLERKLEPMAQTASATELDKRQQALAAAMRTARASAKPGDLVPLRVAVQIRETAAADARRRTPQERRASREEVPGGGVPGINRDYPEQAALATVPPLLLGNLPKLPDNLQYRFYGRHLVVLDGDIEIVVDYVTNVLPR